MSRKILQLSLDGTSFPVPQRAVLDLIDHHRELLDAPSYEVQSAVPADLFQQFVKFLTTDQKITLNSDNFQHFSLLAEEFFLEDLADECRAFVPSISSLVDRISALERIILSLDSVKLLPEQVAAHERQIEVIFARLSSEAKPVGDLPVIERLVERPVPPRAEETPRDASLSEKFVERGDRVIEPVQKVVEPGDGRYRIECPMKKDEPLNGIISYLTARFGGNRYDRDRLLSLAVVQRSIVKLGAQHDNSSGNEWALQYCIDFAPSARAFRSGSNADQWVRFDFTDFRIVPTHYTLRSYYLKSWVLEASLDGKTWTEIDRQTNTQYFREKEWVTMTFPVAKPIECQLVRLTQKGKNHYYDFVLYLAAVEFFGTIIE
jgi:hypothetical protein